LKEVKDNEARLNSLQEKQAVCFETFQLSVSKLILDNSRSNFMSIGFWIYSEAIIDNLLQLSNQMLSLFWDTSLALLSFILTY